jgi:hypothetical protein
MEIEIRLFRGRAGYVGTLNAQIAPGLCVHLPATDPSSPTFDAESPTVDPDRQA